MLARLKFDLDSLANELLDHLPAEVFKSSTTTFMDPCMGGGQFVAAIENRLRSYGHSDENISQRVFGVESSRLRINYAINTHKLVGQYSYCENYLEYDEKMKFDVVIGNPPYQHPTNKSMKLWTLFSIKALELSNAHTLMVTPSVWLEKPKVRAFKYFTDAIKNRLVLIKTNTSDHFPEVGERIGLWHAVKHNESGFTVDGRYYDQPYNQELITSRKEIMLVAKLKEKFLEGTTLRETKIIDFYYSTSHAIKKGFMSNTETTVYDIPVFITANKIAYTKKEHIKPCYKLILNKSGYYYKKDDIERLMFIPATQYYGVGEGGVGIPCSSIEEAKKARDLYSKKIFRFFIDYEKTSGFNSGLLSLPVLDLTKNWSDQDLYEYFKLTQDEIDYVEENSK